MGYRATEWVWDNYLGSSSGSDKLILLRLARHADDDTGECFPSIECLSTKVNRSERQVQSVIKRLEEDGIISVHRGGGRQSNTYRLLGYIASLACPTLHPTPEVHFTPEVENGGIISPLTNTSGVKPTSPHPRSLLHPTPEAHFTSGVKPTSPEYTYNIHSNTIKPLNTNYVVAPVGDDTTHTPSTISDNPTVTDMVTTPPKAESQPTGTIVSPTVNDPPKAQVPNPETSTTIEGSATSSDLAIVSNTEAHAIHPPPVIPPREETVTRKRAKPVAEEKSQTNEKAPRTYSDQQKMVGAIVKVFGWDMSKLTSSNRGLVGKVARDLLEATATPADVQGLYDFCKLQNWSGGFGPAALTSQWANYYALKHQPTPNIIENDSGMVFRVYTPDPKRKRVAIQTFDPITVTEEDLANIPKTPEGRMAQLDQTVSNLTNQMTLKPHEVDLDAIPDDPEMREALCK